MNSRSSAAGRLARWARTVGEIERGYRFTFDDYLNDLDLRRSLDEQSLTGEQSARLHHLDARFRRATHETGHCLWGEENAMTEGWSSETEWYYWRLPINRRLDFHEE